MREREKVVVHVLLCPLILSLLTASREDGAILHRLLWG